MQSPMFVFAGFTRDESVDSLISVLLESLNRTFSEQQPPVSFTRKDRLLTSGFEDVSFYVSIFDEQDEIKEWYQMAEDFELTTNPNPIDKDFEKRLEQKKKQSPLLYKDVHYSIGRVTYAELSKFSVSVYFFF